MSRRRDNSIFFASRTAVLLLLALGGGISAAHAEEGESLTFLRVHVPAERLSEVPLGGGRYVPMTLAEFRAAFAEGASTVADATGGRAVTPTRTVIADQATYTLAWTPTEGFQGTAEVTLGPDISGLRRAIPLGGQAVSQATFASAVGTGAAEICGLPDGSVAVIAEAEGTYGWQFSLPPGHGGQLGPVFHLPLVPSVFTSVELQLPAGFVPLVKGAEAVHSGAAAAGTASVGTRGEDPAMMAWRLELGPTSQLDGTIAAEPLPDVPLSCWSQLAIERQSVAITTSVLPMVPWTTTALRLRVDPGVMVVAARLADKQGTASVSWKPWSSADGAEEVQEDGILVQLPRRVVGTRTPVIIESIAEFTIGTPSRLPVVAAPAGLWAGGGLHVSVDPRLVVEAFTPMGFLPVDAATVDGWPVSPLPFMATEPGLDAGPRFAFEAQASNAVLDMTVSPRRPDVQVRRVTTVDISAGSVMAQAACEVEVARGEIFELVARVAPGWLIDSVEIPSRTERPDWRVEPSGSGSELRIGLINGVAGGTEIRVNVMGHRGPLREGEPFAQASLEMLRLDNEQAAALEIRTNAEMTIDGAGQTVSSVALEQVPSVLRRLAGDTGVRLRLLTSERDNGRVLRLLRRRPPIDVQTQVRLTVRDDRLTESFTLECAPRDAEIDSVVVHFSEPTSDGMEWSLLPPTTGQLLARRLQPQEPRDPSHGMESWLLELVPSARGTITLRGVQTVPFTGPTNVPLAWVEGAASPVGELQIRDGGRRRPLVVNRTLSEIPGVVGESERYATSVSRFLFDPLRDLAGGQPAARLVPGDDEGGAPRAWAWNETTTCWCHTSGEIEYETVFDIENHGRSQIVLSHPPDKQIQEIRVDGVQLVAGVRQTLGGETVIELPAGRRMIRLEIRALASAQPLLPGWQLAWQVDPVAGVIDLPVLERLWQVGVPPGLRIAHVPAMHHRLAVPQIGWTERLLGSSMRSLAAGDTTVEPSSATPAMVDGFRLFAFTPTSGRSTAAGLLLVSSQLVIAAALVLAMVMTLATWFFTRRSPAVAAAVCGVAAVAALWAPQNGVEVVRAAWWGAALGLAMPMLGGRATKGVLRAAVAVCALGGVATAADAEVVGEPPLKVFFTGESGESTVLVPDRLFRELGRGIDAVETLGVRVERVTLVAAVPDLAGGGLVTEPEAWLLTVDLTSDSNTVCTLRQPAGGGRFLAGSLELDGSEPGEVLNESVSADGRILRVPLAVPGRHRLSVQVLPAVKAAGAVGMATIGIPVAPQAGLRLVETAAIDVAAVLVERERNGMPVASGGAGSTDATAGLIDVARSDTLRLCWPTEPGGRLTQDPKLVAARNDISWEAAGCTVVASFQFEPGEGAFRSFVVAADPRLEPALEELPDGSEPITIRRIDEASWLVERTRPGRGRATVSVPFMMPLADPVGVFRVPEVQLVSDSLARATQLVQFVPAAGYVATARLPAGVSAVTPGDATSGSGWLAWRREPRAARGDAPAAVGVTVVREPTTLRGTQRLRLDWVDGGVRLRFDASLDSPDTALATLRVHLPAGWTVRQVGLARLTTPRTGALQATPQDIHWTQTDAATLEIVSQQPRSGRFRFDLELNEPTGNAGTGELEIPRIDGLGETPVIVEWPTDGGVQVETGAADGAALLSSSDWQSLERMPASILAYRRGIPAVQAAATDDVDQRETEADDRPPSDLANAESDSPDGAPRVELLEVRFATDERGKAWGVARVDLVPTRRLVRMQLPVGMRLFEVFVDEHPLRARPVGEAAWELELLDVSRPRTIQVIFAGDIDEQLVSGRPLRLEPPKFPGIPTRDVLWMIRAPRGLDMRLLAPSAEASAEVFKSIRRQATARLMTTLRRSLEGSDPRERQRVEEQVATQLERSQPSAAEQAWNRTSLALSADVFATTTDADGGIIARAAARPTPTDSSRAVATAVAILAAGGAWSLAVRSPMRMTLLLVRFGPYAVLILAAVWVALLTPAWPGGLIGAGAAVVIVRRLVASSFRGEAAQGGLVIRDACVDRSV